MEKLYSTIQKIEQKAPPFDISKTVIKRIILRRIRALITVGVAAVSTFAYLLLRIYAYLIDTGAGAVLRVIITDFELSWDYITQSWDGLIETMPVAEIRYLALNILVILALAIYYYRIRRTQISFAR